MCHFYFNEDKSETVTEHQRQDYEAVPEAVRLLTSGGPLNPPILCVESGSRGDELCGVLCVNSWTTDLTSNIIDGV